MSNLKEIVMGRAFGRVIRNIPYAREGALRGVGDLFLPHGRARGAPVLLIHGGGWNALDKTDFEFLLPVLALAGRPVFNINYRYLSQAAWPACGEDTVAAGKFLLAGGLAEYGLTARDKILICGASAGGHLAMMTGLNLSPERVEAIVSMAGPCRIDWHAQNLDPTGNRKNFLPLFFGRDIALNDPLVAQASPIFVLAKLGHVPPRLFCLHSSNDTLCPPIYSTEAVSAWKRAGGTAEVDFIDGDGMLHGFWVNDDRESAVLRPDILIFFARVFDALNAKIDK